MHGSQNLFRLSILGFLEGVQSRVAGESLFQDNLGEESSLLLILTWMSWILFHRDLN